MALAGQNLMDLLRTQLQVKQGEVDSLLEVTRAINFNYSENDILLLYQQILQYQLGIEKLVLFSLKKDWQSILDFGLEEKGKAKNQNFVEHIKGVNNVLMVQDDDRFGDFEMVVPVFHKEKPLAYVLCTLPRMESYEVLDDKVTFVQTITNIIIVAMENKKLFRRQLEQEALKKELTLAKSVQEMLVPSVMFQNQHIELAAIYKPHRDIGGDYYDYVQVNDDEVVFVIADVAGKGISAALLMANFQATLRTLLTQDIKPIPFIIQLNERLFEITKGERFITLFIGKYTFSTRRLRYVNAGHNPSILIKPNGERELLKVGCTVLGIFEELPSIDVAEFKLEKGSVICNYTDGLTDLCNNAGEELDMDWLIDQIEKPHAMGMEEFNTRVLENIEKFKEDQGYVDDISLLNCKIL